MDGPTVLRVKRPRELHSSDVLVLDFQASGASSLADQLAAAAVLSGQQQQQKPPASAPAAKRRRYVRVCAGADSQVQDPQQLWALLQHLPSSSGSSPQPPSHTRPATPAATSTTTSAAFQSAAGVTVVDLQHSAANHWAVLRSRPPSRQHNQQQQQQQQQQQGTGVGGAAGSEQGQRVQLSAQEQQELPQPLQELLLEVLEQQQQQQQQQQQGQGQGLGKPAADTSTAAKPASGARPRHVVRRRPAAPDAAPPAAAAGGDPGPSLLQQQEEEKPQHQHQQQQQQQQQAGGEAWQCELLPDAELLRTQMALGDYSTGRGGSSSSGGGGGAGGGRGPKGGSSGSAGGQQQQDEWLYDVYVAADDVGALTNTMSRGGVEATAAGDGGCGGMGEGLDVEGVEEEPAAVSIELWEEDAAQLDLLLALTGAAPADAAARDDPAALDSEDSNAEGYYAASYPDDDTDPEERLSELLGGDECESSEGEDAWWDKGEAQQHSSSRPNGIAAQGYDLSARFGHGLPVAGPGYAAAAGGGGSGGPYATGGQGYSTSNHSKRHRGRGEGVVSSEEYDAEEYEEEQEAAWRRQLLQQVREQQQQQGQGDERMGD